MPTIQTNKREGNVRIRAKKDGTLSVEQDWYYRILADTPTQDRNEILLNTDDTPKFGVLYSNGLLLKGCDGSRLDEDPLLWDCVFNMSNQVEEGENVDQSDGSHQIGSPTEWIPVVELGFEDYDEVFVESLAIATDELDTSAGGSETDGQGYNATLWVNSAGQEYETGFIRQHRIMTRKFVQFEPISGVDAVTLDDIEARNDTLNDDTYLGKPKRTLKLSVDAVAAGFYYGLRCWRVDYTLAYKPTDWRLKKLDVGWYYLEDGQKKPFLDDSEPKLNIQGALNGYGAPAADQRVPAIRAHKEFESVHFNDFLRLHLS